MAKRVKVVMNSQQVAHVWAQQCQPEGRNSSTTGGRYSYSGGGTRCSTFYFSGPAIYSYRDAYPVGEFLTGADGQPVVLIWSGKYSVTTSQHTSMAEGAVSNRRRHKVPHLPAARSWGERADRIEECHGLNLAWFADTLAQKTADALAKAGRVSRHDPRHEFTSAHEGHYHYEGNAAGFKARALRYCADFGLDVPAYIAAWDAAEHLAEFNRRRDASEARKAERVAKMVKRHGSVEAWADYERSNRLAARLNRLASASYIGWRERQALADLVSEADALISSGGKVVAGLAPSLARLRARQADELARAERERAENADRAARAAREREMLAEQRAAPHALPVDELAARWRAGEFTEALLTDEARALLWREGERVAVSYSGPTMIRLSPRDPGTLETSRGAEVPADHARRVWPVLRRLYRTGGTYVRNGHTIHIGHFALDSVDADGTMRAGCHTFTRAEIERCAALLDLPPVAAPESVDAA